MAGSKAPLKTYCTTREAAEILGISVRTAQLWVESGILEAWKTEGGHRRILRTSVESLLVDAPGSSDRGRASESEDDHAFTILVAEDDLDLLRLYQLTLPSWPLRPRVLVATNGFQALTLLGLHKPDMLVTDLHMPGMDGFEMLRALDEMPEMKGIAMVAVTGLDEEEVKARGGLPEGMRLLPKPVPFDELRRIAEAKAGKRRS